MNASCPIDQRFRAESCKVEVVPNLDGIVGKSMGVGSLYKPKPPSSEEKRVKEEEQIAPEESARKPVLDRLKELTSAERKIEELEAENRVLLRMVAKLTVALEASRLK